MTCFRNMETVVKEEIAGVGARIAGMEALPVIGDSVWVAASKDLLDRSGWKTR